MYNDLPGGQYGVAQMWSGDIINAQYYLAKGAKTEDLRYLYAARRQGHGRQRHPGDAEARAEPRARARVHQLHARHRRTPSTTSATSATSRRSSRSTRTTSCRTATSRRTSLRPWSSTSGSRRATDCSSCRRRPTPRGTGLAAVQGRRLTMAPGRSRHSRAAWPAALWPALALPGTVWLLLLFLVPLYVVLAIVFGGVDPFFRTPVPVWNPFAVEHHAVRRHLPHIFGPTGSSAPALVRTAVYVLSASVAVPADRLPGRLLRRALRPAGAARSLLALLIAPFWISYMMRMLAWVNLLQNDGLVNRALSSAGCSTRDRRLAERPRRSSSFSGWSTATCRT